LNSITSWLCTRLCGHPVSGSVASPSAQPISPRARIVALPPGRQCTCGWGHLTMDSCGTFDSVGPLVRRLGTCNHAYAPRLPPSGQIRPASHTRLHLPHKTRRAPAHRSCAGRARLPWCSAAAYCRAASVAIRWAGGRASAGSSPGRPYLGFRRFATGCVLP
jgi:hypothetical protein